MEISSQKRGTREWRFFYPKSGSGSLSAWHVICDDSALLGLSCASLFSSCPGTASPLGPICSRWRRRPGDFGVFMSFLFYFRVGASFNLLPLAVSPSKAADGWKKQASYHQGGEKSTLILFASHLCGIPNTHIQPYSGLVPNYSCELEWRDYTCQLWQCDFLPNLFRGGCVCTCVHTCTYSVNNVHMHVYTYYVLSTCILLCMYTAHGVRRKDCRVLPEAG